MRACSNRVFYRRAHILDKTHDHRIVARRVPREPDAPLRRRIAQPQNARVAQQMLRARRQKRRADARRHDASTDWISSVCCVTRGTKPCSAHQPSICAASPGPRLRARPIKPSSLRSFRSDGSRFQRECCGTASASASSITGKADKQHRRGAAESRRRACPRATAASVPPTTDR